MLGNIGPLEIILVLVIALIVFGPKRLPQMGRSIGRGINEFREAITNDHDDDDDEDFDDDDEPVAERDRRKGPKELEAGGERAEPDAAEQVEGEVVVEKRD